METIEAVLAAHPFFQGMAPQHLAALATCGRRVQFNAGDFLCREDEEALDFYVIISGSVSVEIFSARRGPLTTTTVEEEEVLGWLWFEKPYHWHLDAEPGRSPGLWPWESRLLRPSVRKIMIWVMSS